MTISQVDRGGSNAGGFETDRECKALIDPSVPQMCERKRITESIPHKAAASAELNSIQGLWLA